MFKASRLSEAHPKKRNKLHKRTYNLFASDTFIMVYILVEEQGTIIPLYFKGHVKY